MIFTRFWSLISATATPGHGTGHSGLQRTPKGTGTDPKAPFLLATNHSPCNSLSASNTNTTLTSRILGTVQLSVQIWITSRVRPSPNCIHIDDFLFRDLSLCLYTSKILQRRFSRLYWINNFSQHFSQAPVPTRDHKHSTNSSSDKSWSSWPDMSHRS